MFERKLDCRSSYGSKPQALDGFSLCSCDACGFVRMLLGESGLVILGRRSGLQVDAIGTTITDLEVIDNSDLIASAFPGGLLVVSSGAILRAESEAELAALVAHAMGHVQAGLHGSIAGKDCTVCVQWSRQQRLGYSRRHD